MYVAGLEGTLAALRPTASRGWVGYWSPGIGDPTPIGWLTVALYFAAAILCWYVVRRKLGMSRSERWLWYCLVLTLVGLGVNKQLDLQTALTELGRILAAKQGWYEQRHRVQRAFILVIGLVAIAAAVALLAVTRRAPRATQVTALGALALITFVLVRASSQHHVDLFIGERFWGIKGNWLLEVGGLVLLLVGATWRLFVPDRERRAPGASDAGQS